MKSFAWHNIRLDSIGSPFRNVMAGVPENDSVNNERYNRGLQAFITEYRSTSYLSQRRITSKLTRSMAVLATSIHSLFQLWSMDCREPTPAHLRSSSERSASLLLSEQACSWD